MTGEEMAVKFAEVEHRAKSNTRRIDKLEQTTDAIHSLATSVEILVKEQKHQTEAMADIKNDVAKLDGKVDALEKKPAKKWENIKEKVIWAVLASLITFLLSMVGL